MPEVESRVWKKIEKTETCWLWLGCTINGYGQMKIPGSAKKRIYTHRFFYERLVGPIPEGLQLDHLCRVRNCVNPEHLEPVTGRVNTLRGTSPVAQRAKQTHCLNGHPLVGSNLINSKPTRQCRICTNARKRKYKARAKQLRAATKLTEKQE